MMVGKQHAALHPAMDKWLNFYMEDPKEAMLKLVNFLVEVCDLTRHHSPSCSLVDVLRQCP